jgi:hypothetical protein
MRPRLDWRQQFTTVDPTQHEAIGACLWDRQNYVDNTTVTLAFFTAVRVTRELGNLSIASQLPAGIHFLIQAIRVVPILRSNKMQIAAGAGGAPEPSLVDDLYQLYNGGVLTIDILQKQYAEYPIFLLLPGTGVVSFVALASGIATVEGYESATVGHPDNRAVYTLAQPIAIPPITNFNARIDWPGGAVNTFTGDMLFEVVFDGQLIRPKQ